MKIGSEILNRLFATYRESVTVSDELVLNQRAFDRAFQFIEDNLPSHFDWNERTKNADVAAILTKSLKIHEGQLVFNELVAQAAINTLEAETLYLARDTAAIGLQEKYLKSQLTAQEPLSELDVKRFLVNTGMIDHVHATSLSAQNIGVALHHARLNHVGVTTPYSLNMMLNSAGEGAYPSWLAVNITVDPISYKLTYRINSGDKLTSEQKAEIERIVTDGLTFESEIDGTAYSAFPRAAKTSGIITSAPTISKLGGYKVLHELYKEPSLAAAIASNTSATNFTTTDNDIKAIKQAVYEVELSAIQLSPEPNDVLQAQIIENFDEYGKIKRDALSRQLRMLGAPVISGEAQPQHSLVTTRIGELQLFHKKIRFPGEEPSHPLSGVDYEQFLLLTEEKFRRAGVKKTLDEMIISCYDNTALEGLIAFNETNTPLPFQTLTLDLNALDLSDLHAPESFLFNLETMLLTMSDNNLTALKFIDDGHKLTEDMVKHLTNFILARGIAIDVNLPEPFKTSDMQRQIDEATSDHIRQRNITALNKIAIPDTKDTPMVSKAVRKRPKLVGKQTASVDVELQQEQQTEVAVEAGTALAAGAEPEAGESEVLNLFTFQATLRAGEFTHANGYLINDDLVDHVLPLWTNWVGLMSMKELLETDGILFSRSACEEMLRYKDKFPLGIDLKNLPAGFMLKRQPETNRLFLHFDPGFKAVASYNPLQIQTTELPGEAPLPNAVFEKALSLLSAAHPIKRAWDRLNTAPYNKSANLLFKQFLPQMMLLDEAKLEHLFTLSFNADNTLAINKFQFLLENAAKIKPILSSSEDLPANIGHALQAIFADNKTEAQRFIENYEELTLDFPHHLLHQLVDDDTRTKILELITAVPDINLNALLQVYVQLGNQGIKELIALAGKDQVLFKQLNTAVFAKTKTYAPFLTAEYKDAITVIQGFSKEEKVWWDTLLKQHGEAQSDVNLVDLVNAFKAFKIGLSKLSLPAGATPLTFPAACGLTGSKSMPVALGRVLTLLKHAREEDRQAQWQNVSGLDLSSTGMIKAISAKMDSGKLWAFITPEMKINVEHEAGAEPLGSRTTKYQAPESWRNIRKDENISQDFFRYVAFQKKNAQMPLEFYRHVHDTIMATNLSPAAKSKLLSLIAAASTSIKTVNTIGSLEDAKKDADALIKLIVRPLPALAPELLQEQVRASLLSSFYNLSDIPPLPIFYRLTRLIASSIINPANIPLLAAANENLQRHTVTYRDAIYEGMKDYDATDYDKGQLFFDHMALINTIDVRLRDSYPVDANILIAILSSFHLKKEEITALLDQRFPSSEVLEGLDAAGRSTISRQNLTLELLKRVSRKHRPDLRALDYNDLQGILNKVGADPAKDVSILLKDLTLEGGLELKDYYPVDFLENFNKSVIPDEVLSKLAENFNEQQRAQLSRVLLRFPDALQYGMLVDKLITITGTLNAVEKNIFIVKLTNTLGLYTNPLPLEAANNPFVNLIDYMVANGVDEFLNFVTAERHLFKKGTEGRAAAFFVPVGTEKVVSDLDRKAILFMETLMPSVQKIAGLVINLVDLQPRMHETLLKTPVAQLTAVSGVVSESLPHFGAFEGNLTALRTAISNGTSIDFSEEARATQAFIDSESVENADLFSKYYTALNELKTVPISPVDLGRMLANPSFLQLLGYIQDPASVTDDHVRALLDEKVRTVLVRHPTVATNKNLIKTLLKNPAFFRALSKSDALAAATSPNLLRDDSLLETFFAALDTDLQKLDTFKEQTEQVQEQLLVKKAELNQYPSVFTALFKKINALAAANPASKKQILELYERHLEHYSPAEHGELLKYISDFVTTLKNSFDKIDDKNIVLSLCLQFGEDNSEFQPKDLIALLEEIEKVPAAQQIPVLKIAVALINNEKGYKFEDFKRLCILIKANEAYAAAIIPMYKKAPFPTIKQVEDWHAAAVVTTDYAGSMEASYLEHSKHPCAREANNGFKVTRAEEQLKKFICKSFDVKHIINPTTFATVVQEMSEKSTDELLTLFKTFNPIHLEHTTPVDYDKLVAVAAELFHRAKGREGNSMEINSTQYLAILSSLKTPGHVTSEIGTGEGKSRIMMISIACQYALGNTVDFVTSDAALATRDFVEYQAYFDMLDAQTSMIFAQTDPSLYKIGGINFSDPANLSLFRNKARSLGKGHLVIDPEPTRRALLLDEADKTYFDVADTRFNFSKEGEENIRGMEWVYPLLMEYLAQKSVTVTPEERATLPEKVDPKTKEELPISSLDIYWGNIDLSREKFLQFASGHTTATELMRLKALSNEQLEQWQVSAVTASQLKFKDDFVIEPDVLISTPTGPKVSSEAQLLSASRVSKSSKYSFGIHQCLHARLNLARERIDTVEDATLREALSACEQPFYVAEEKQIVYSSTSKNLLDDYKTGQLKAVTGTSGSILERKEAQALYSLARGAPATAPEEVMHFIDVPRDKGSLRKDRAVRLTGNASQQLNALVEQIKEARAKNQPILIIAETDKESELLFAKLKVIFNDDAMQHIHSQLSDKAEKASIVKAGHPRQITVSTGMIGRGTDIPLYGDARTHGLNVMLTYLPRQRDLLQIVGRSGRFGAAGETSIVLDKQRLKDALGKSTLTDGYYRDAEAYILREQALMDRHSQSERLIKSTVGDFRKILTDDFFEGMLSKVNRTDYKKLMSHWTVFFEKSDKAWNEKWPLIQQEVAKEPIAVDRVDQLLSEYQDSVQKLWNTLRRNIQDEDVLCLDGQKPITKLPEDAPPLRLNQKTRALLTGFDSHRGATKERIYDHYDPGHEGRAVKYSHWSIPLIASLKGYANLLPYVNFTEARRPFANLRAWFEGHGQLFPEFRASPNKWRMAAAMLLGLLGGIAGGVLTATGVLAPLGITVMGLSVVVSSALVSGAVGVVAGAVVGAGGGAIADAVVNRAVVSTASAKVTEEPVLPPPALVAEEPDLHGGSYGAMSAVADLHHTVPANGSAEDEADVEPEREVAPAPADTFQPGSGVGGALEPEPAPEDRPTRRDSSITIGTIK